MLAARNSWWFVGFGVVAIGIGLIHNLFPGQIYHRVAAIAPGPLALRFGYFFAAMGTAVIQCGLVLVLVARGLRQGDRLARQVAWCSVAYLLVALIAATACGIMNPLSLAVLVGAVVSGVLLAM